MATIILPKLLGNDCKGVKIIHFSIKIIFGQLLYKFGNFYLVTLLLSDKNAHTMAPLLIGSFIILKSTYCYFLVNLIKHFTIVIYNSRVVWLENGPYYDFRVVIYARKMFKRLAAVVQQARLYTYALILKKCTLKTLMIGCDDGLVSSTTKFK